MGKQLFEIKEEHLKLLKRAYVSWDNCEFGAPAINCKRPYGNSDVLSDIAEIINFKPKIEYNEDEDEDEDEVYFSPEEEKYLKSIHKETKMALQIILAVGKFEIGGYESDKYGDNWKKVW